MNAGFFALALVAALNVKLLAVDLLLIENRRPRAMFTSILLGGMGVALTFGLVDVLVAHADVIKTQGSLSAEVDLALGLLLVIFGGLVATSRLPGQQRAMAPAGDAQQKKKSGWAERVLSEPRLGLAVVVGALIGIPGAAYLSALRNLEGGKSSTAAVVVAVVVFVVIEFLLIIVPWAFVEFRPDATKMLLKNAQDWLLGHAKQLMASVALFLGAYMAISGLVRLS